VRTAFSQHGAQVVVIDQDVQALADLESEGLGGTAHAAWMLHSDYCDLTALTAAADRAGGMVHALINCHSYSQPVTRQVATGKDTEKAMRWDILGVGAV